MWKCTVNNEVLKKSNFLKIDPKDINQECESRNKKLSNTSKEQYDLIKHLPFVEV